MNNRKMEDKMNILIIKSFQFFDEVKKNYGVINTSMVFFGLSKDETGYDIDYAINYFRNNKGRMFAISSCTPQGDDPDGDIVEEVRSVIYIPFENIYGHIIDCELDFDKVFEAMKFVIRHEIGHIIEARKNIGISVDEWNKRAKEIFEEPDYSNSSDEEKMKYWLEYNEIESEKKANNNVGITREEIIEYFNIISGYPVEKKWEIFSESKIKFDNDTKDNLVKIAVYISEKYKDSCIASNYGDNSPMGRYIDDQTISTLLEDTVDFFSYEVIGLCECGCINTTIKSIRNYLSILNDWSNDIKNSKCLWKDNSPISNRKHKMKELFGVEDSCDDPLVQYLAYTIDTIGLSEHGSSISGAWITDLGRMCLYVFNLYLESEDSEEE